MHSRLLSMTAGLSDKDLLSRVLLLARQEREATVELIGHLAELDARKLHLAQGYGSLFTYCTGALRLSEHAAYNRIEAARLSRRFPAVLDLLADGSLNVSTARLLAPHLRSDTFEKLVAQARGRSKREVEELVARLSPRPDVAASVRKLPARGQTVHSVATTGPVDTPMATDDGHSGTGLAVEPEEGANLPPPAAPGSRGTSLLAIAAPTPEDLPQHRSRRRWSSRPTSRPSPRWPRSGTACSSPSGRRPTRSFAGPRSSCAARSRMGIPARSSIGH
jgi:Domain of unknown function (DUF222)